MLAPPARLPLALLLALAALLAPTPASGDVFAAVNVAAPPPRTDLDVAVVNASLGTRVALPASVNTTALEIHPSVSSDGRRLVFFRTGGTDGQRLLIVDTSTGASADLFSPAELLVDPILNSNITADGATVLTGRRFHEGLGAGQFRPRITRTDVRAFPAGPFPRTTTALGPSFTTRGSVTHVAASGNGILVLRLLPSAGPGQLLFVKGSIALLRSATVDYGQAALEADDPPIVHFEQRSFSSSGPTFGNSDLASRVTHPLAFKGTGPANGPFLSAADESQPALTADGRYFAFVRHGADGHDRLFVQDNITRTVLNASGVDLGLVATRGIGSVSLYLRNVITSSAITRTGNVNGTLASAASIGILVQRIVGTSGNGRRRQYELEDVGRYPLGSFGAGNVFTTWDFTVDGVPLPKGRYLVTVRAVEEDVVLELGVPQVVKIDKRGRVRVLRERSR